MSKNVRNELGSYLTAGYSYGSVYSPDEAFYLLNIRGAGVVYVFDMRGNLEDGSSSVTGWNAINPLGMRYRTVEKDVLIGKETGDTKYTGNLDGGTTDGSGGSGYQM